MWPNCIQHTQFSICNTHNAQTNTKQEEPVQLTTHRSSSISRLDSLSDKWRQSCSRRSISICSLRCSRTFSSRICRSSSANCAIFSLSARQNWSVSWSLTSRFSTNMAMSETKGQGWRAIPTLWRKATHPHITCSQTSLASSPSENPVQAGDDSLQVPTRIGADVLGRRLSGNLCSQLASDTYSPLSPGYCQYQEQRPCWGRGVLQSQVQSSETVYQPPCELQLSPHWRSLDIWRPTCSGNRQCIWGPFMKCSTNLLILSPNLLIIIIIIINGQITGESWFAGCCSTFFLQLLKNRTFWDNYSRLIQAIHPSWQPNQQLNGINCPTAITENTHTADFQTK